jgi:hypothetical protein
MLLRVHASECFQFWAWAVLGCAAAVGALAFGMPALAAVVFAGALIAGQGRLRRPALGFVTGLGAPLLYVAWLNRAGPGVTCWGTATATGCDQHLNPLPWFLVGLVLFVGGVVAYSRRGA